jgi:hypothetical protein
MYSFVSGIVLDGAGARAEATAAYDGSEMYQTYLATRLVAAGGRLLAIDRVEVEKDLQILGERVDSYRLKRIENPRRIIERPLPVGKLLQVVAGGLEPFHFGRARERNLVDAARQLYSYTYPFWIIEYRRVQSWRYSVGVLLGFRPSRVAKGLNLSVHARIEIWLIYIVSAIFALSVPISLFDAVRPILYRVAKRVRPIVSFGDRT